MDQQSLDRRAEVARLYAEGWTQREIAVELGSSPSVIARDTKALGISRPPGKPEKYPPVTFGVCGTAGCTEPDCSIPRGECHCGCGAETPIATRHDRRRGYIKSKPERFLRAHYDRDREEYRRFHADKMTATMNELMSDPRRKANWVRSRHSYPGLPPNTRYYGYLGAQHGIEGAPHGREGGADRKATDEQVNEVWNLYGQGQTSREIAAAVFGDPKLKDRVLRILRSDA